MTTELNFGKLFSVSEHFTKNTEIDPDTNFFENISSLDIKYFTMNETKTFVSDIDPEYFTILHLNISMKKNI